MMRSLFSGVSGLGIHQTKMDVIANNISNVNTIGFKAATVTFSDVYSQTISGATMPNAATGRGGSNPMQIGLGANVASITNLMSSGTPQRTNQASDLMIEGDGFFIVGDDNGTYFTRSGAFVLDKEGYLTLDGLRLQGWNVQDDPDNPGEQRIVQGEVQSLNINAGSNAYAVPQVTTTLDYEGNININKSPQNNTLTIYDSVGNSYLFNTTMTYVGNASGGYWDFTMGDTAVINGDTRNPVAVVGIDTDPVKIAFKDGLPDETASDALQISLQLTAPTEFNSTFADNITLDFSGLTAFTASVDATVVTKDGCTAGTLQGYSIGTDGKVTGSYTNGTTKLLGQIPIAVFANPAGLEKLGNSLYTTTPNSGNFDGIGLDVQAGGGNMRSGVLEMSNVDLATEFTTMITTQRGFQANSRTITTSDDMLQELVNLKR